MTEDKKAAFLSLDPYLNVTVLFVASGAWQEQESPAARRVLSYDKLFYYFMFVLFYTPVSLTKVEIIA